MSPARAAVADLGTCSSSSRPTSTAPCCTPTAPSPTRTRAVLDGGRGPRRHRRVRHRPADPLDATSCGSTSATTAWRSAPTAASCTTSRPAPCAAPGRSPSTSGCEVAGLMREAVPGTTFALEKTTGFGKEPDVHGALPAARRTSQVGPLDEIFDDTTVKLLARHEELDPEEFWAAAEEAGRPPGHHHLVVGRRAGRDQRRRGHQGEHAGAALRRARRRRATRWSPSGTCPTTWRCSSGPARRTPWPTRTRASSTLADRRRPANEDDGVAAVLEELFGL